MEIEALLRDVIEAIVDDEEAVDINIIESQSSHIIELAVGKNDIGKVIGRGGRTADALRTILSCMGAKYRTRYVLQRIDG